MKKKIPFQLEVKKNNPHSWI